MDENSAACGPGAKKSWLTKTSESWPFQPARTEAGIETELIYTSEDLEGLDEARDIGLPGEPPFTRGPYPTMYRGKLWTMRQYAGFGTAEESNQRFKYLLEQGVTGLSVAFDLPSQIGYDSDDPLVEEEVGRCGVAIDTLADMERLFQDIPLEQVSVNLTINSTAIIMLAMLVVLAQKQGIALEKISGTTQNDMIKEFLARKTYIFPIEPSLKIVTDLIEYCHRSLPRFNPISISGYHIRELGASPVQEVALTMEAAITYAEGVIARGIGFDEFAPRLSFQFTSNMELFEEVAKYRAARKIWSSIAQEHFGAKDLNSGRLRVFAGGTGDALTLEEPFNNIIRATIQCLVGALGGAQAIHVPAYDEAYALPSQEAATLALRTQQILAYETGIIKTVDPLGGSYYVEYLTRELERRTRELMAEIEGRGGLIASIQDGYIQGLVQRRAYELEKARQAGTRIRVGVNKFRSGGKGSLNLQTPGREQGVLSSQKTALARVKSERNQAEVARRLEELKAVLPDRRINIFSLVIEAVRAYASVGEIVQVLKSEYGEYRDLSGF